MLEADPVACRPGAQLLVDAFPSHADHLANLLLGNSDGSASLRELVFLGQTKKCAGEPARQILKDNLFNLITGPSQPRAEQLDELHRQRRLASHKGKKIAAINDINLAIGICRRVGCPCQSIEHGDFPESLARADT